MIKCSFKGICYDRFGKYGCTRNKDLSICGFSDLVLENRDINKYLEGLKKAKVIVETEIECEAIDGDFVIRGLRTALRFINKEINETINKKDTTMKMEFDENDLNICPVCKERVMTDDNYCRNYGQKIILE